MFSTAMESLFRQDYNTAETIIESIKDLGILEKEAVESAHMGCEEIRKFKTDY